MTFHEEVLTSIAETHVFFDDMMKYNKLLFAFFFYLRKKPWESQAVSKCHVML